MTKLLQDADGAFNKILWGRLIALSRWLVGQYFIYLAMSIYLLVSWHLVKLQWVHTFLGCKSGLKHTTINYMIRS